MTSFATCAYPECMRRIPYNKIDYSRSRYCEEHESTILKRMGMDVVDNIVWDSFNILIVKPKPEPVQPIPFLQKMIVIRCPICKFREEISADRISGDINCSTYGCEGKMLYHKDVEVKDVG